MGVTWTKEQQQVIDLRDRNILVSAAAGSGKTAVLVERIISMLTVDANPVDVDRLLIVTFTEAAAGEMKGIFIPRMPHVEKSSLPGPTTVFVYTSFPGPFANWKVLSLLLCLLWRTHNTEVAALAWCDIIFQFKCQALAESYFSCLEDRSSAGPVNLSYSGG